MNLQIGNKKVTPGQWIVCEMEDGPQITQVEKVIKDTINNKVELWGHWQSKGSIKGDWGCNHIEKCRFATAVEIDDEGWREVFRRKGRIPGQFKTGDWVSDDVYALTVMHQTGNIVTVGIINSNQTYEVAAENLEPLFFKEDMAG
ncbi:hypothetical protein CON65_15810 [Bacillus pseudomycoides]|uniref:Uncharacterized protein n=1 Tax=Bacillus pseudomycoides TaxID=64104 RepID=A0AA91ZSN1_9BACI|nr:MULTISPECIES: hypothetical protein [Bacillus]PEB56224.1 hypothetical protein COO03_01245 [Bacillus sp. AFS098217]PED81654.1 hypothetical protein CON65_15810 [Bacillus pseudomycoides]